jgi:hypothetical protein
MKKIITCILILVSFCFCGIANADYMDDLAAANPNLVFKKEMRQNKYGAESLRRNLKIWRSEWIDGTSFSLRLYEWNNKKHVFFDLDYNGKSWKFYEFMTFGNGESLIKLDSVIRPVHDIKNGGVSEYLMFEPRVSDLVYMRDTKIIRAVFNHGDFHTKIDYNSHIDNTLPFFEAIEHAIKFLNQ